MEGLALDITVKAKLAGESKNCAKYELQGRLKGMIYIPKEDLPSPWPEEINAAAYL